VPQWHGGADTSDVSRLAYANVACNSRAHLVEEGEEQMTPSGEDADAAVERALDSALAVLQEAVGDAGFVAELIDDFLDGLPAQLQVLRAAQSACDLELLHRSAHTLKSNAATFGAQAFERACRELENAARVGQSGVTLELVERVEAEATRAAPALATARDERSG
jgi:HPt (histidine-containing phosphotransfer) domain-containing protein